MNIFCHFLYIYNALKTTFNLCKLLLLGTVMFIALPVQTAANTLDVQVADNLGGRIEIASDDMDCSSHCIVEFSSSSLVSLFALPDKGYRFQSWDGACANTIGSLCTLKPTRHTRLSARFVKSVAPKTATKALLLLHGKGVKHTVWNEFVKQRFNNRCPVIYGGVVLGKDSFDTHNDVFCYRISFGYYEMLKNKIADGILQKVDDDQKAQDGFSRKRLDYEVRAAVLGILDRHPNLSLALVGQANAALAAQSFLQANTAERKKVTGLLALQKSSQAGKAKVPGYVNRDYFQAVDRPVVIKLEAGPEQEGKISAALAQFIKPWLKNR